MPGKKVGGHSKTKVEYKYKKENWEEHGDQIRELDVWLPKVNKKYKKDKERRAYKSLATDCP